MNTSPSAKSCLFMYLWYKQTWALALFFQVRSPLSAHFLSMDRYRSIAHFADFRLTHRSIALKKPVVGSWKRVLKRLIAPKTTAVRSYVCIVYCIYRYIFTALFNPYIAHERTAHNLDFVSSLVALRSYSY